MKLTSIQKIVLAVVAIVVVAVAAIAAFVFPMFGTLQGLDDEARSAEQSKQAAQSLLAQLEQAKQRAAETQAELLKIGTEIPDSPQMPTLIIELQNIGNASGVELTHMSPTEPVVVAGANYSEISIDTQIDGTWADLLDYMRRLNRTTRLLRVTDFSIAPVTTTTTTEETTTVTQEQKVSATLKLKAYVSTTSAVGGGGAASSPPPASGTGGTL